MSNKRIYYAIQQVGLKADEDTGTFTPIKGAQSVGMSTNFNLDQVFQFGELSIYENQEDIPDVEVTFNKVLDGNCPMFLLATRQATEPTLVARSAQRCIFGMAVFSDQLQSATGTPGSVVQCSGMYVGSIGYNFGLEDNFSEDMTLVGNDKVWKNDPKPTASGLPDPTFAGAFPNNSTPPGLGGVNRRENFIFDYDSGEGVDVNGMVADVNTTILPPEVFGISTSGTNEMVNQEFGAHVSSVSVSLDLSRDDINELGRKAPYSRTPNFPVEVSTQIEVTSTSGDMISATEEGIYGTGDVCTSGGNLKDRTIRIATCEGTRIYLGTKNKLSSVNYSGGDAGGGNVSVSYSFTTFNDCTVMHSGDVINNAATLWSSRETYLRDMT